LPIFVLFWAFFLGEFGVKTTFLVLFFKPRRKILKKVFQHSLSKALVVVMYLFYLSKLYI